MKSRVALVSVADDNREALAGYLVRAGFDVHECEELEVATSFGTLILLGEESSTDAILARVRSWLKTTKTQRVMVVTPKPAALRDLLVVHGDRLFVFPAPVFGWELVDALRAEVPARPRGS